MFDQCLKEMEDIYLSGFRSKLQQLVLNDNKKIIIFGAGDVGKTVLSILEQNYKKAYAFCDNYKSGFYFETSVPILLPDDLVDSHNDAIVIIAVSSKQISDAMYDQIVGLGFSDTSIVRSYGDCFLSFTSIKTNFLDGFRWAYHFFSDQESKNIILSRIRGYLFGFDMEYLPWQDIYFPKDIFELSNQEVFIDAGAYDAAISLDLIGRTKGHFKGIYAFEADHDNYLVTRDRLAQYSNTKVIYAGLWHANGTISFISGEGQGSKVDADGASKIPAVALDEFFQDIDIKEYPTFIKMDIEGSEKAAILGAKKIIQLVRPKLAISVYHRPEDIYELPMLINSINSDYRFALRHYTKGYLETVLYAV